METRDVARTVWSLKAVDSAASVISGMFSMKTAILALVRRSILKRLSNNSGAAFIAECPAGYYGQDCLQKCACGDLGNRCDHVDGSCQCNDCWEGANCSDCEFH